MKLNKILLAFSAMSATFGCLTSNSQRVENIVKSVESTKVAETPSSQNTQQPIRSEVKVKNHIKQQENFSYLHNYRNEGIPPKVYGMYYVRKGTHKITNV